MRRLRVAAAAFAVMAATLSTTTSQVAFADTDELVDSGMSTAATYPVDVECDGGAVEAVNEEDVESDSAVDSGVNGGEVDEVEVASHSTVAEGEGNAATSSAGEADSTEHELLAAGFTDVPVSHTFYSDITWLAGKNITTGWPDGTFRPEAQITRAAIAAFLYRYAGSPQYKAPASSPFKDVSVGHQFYKEIAWAAASGLTTGYSDGTFRPEVSVTRGAAAMFLWRLAGNPVVAAVNPFTDLGVCQGQRAGVLWLANVGIAAGYPDHTFKPEVPLTRSAFAAFLHRYDVKIYEVKVSPLAPAKDPSLPAAQKFRDVTASNTFASDIAWASQMGITTGYDDGTFRPLAGVTRDAFVAFLYRFAGSPTYAPPASSPFKDVRTNHPFYREIAWAAASGIAGGYSDGTFRPTETVSRAAVASFLYRAMGNPGGPRAQKFRDTSCSEHRTAIAWLAGAGITTGFSDGGYHPGSSVERQALAAFLHRLCVRGWSVVASPWSKAIATKDAVPTGCVVEPAVAAPMSTVLAGITDSAARDMAVKAQNYSSPNKWLILINQETARVGIFERANGRWYLKNYWAAGPGAAITPTIKGQFSIGNRGYSFGHGYTAYYWTQFYGDFLFHSILYYQGTFNVKDGTLGRKVSHGCVRLALENAKWINENIPRGTTVVSY